MKQDGALKSAKSRAAKYCAVKERSTFEVRSKLISWGLNEDQADGVINELLKDQFLDEERFTKAFCHDKFEFNSWGRNKISYEIRKYKVPKDLVSEVLSEMDNEKYLDRLIIIASKKYNSLISEKNRYKRKQKTVAYLLNKGYEMEFIEHAIENILNSRTKNNT